MARTTRAVIGVASAFVFLLAPAANAQAPAGQTPAAQKPATDESELRLFQLEDEMVASNPNIPRNAKIVRPRKLSGRDPEYTQAALDHDVEGSMSVRCTITVAGLVRDCKVLQGLPFMSSAVVDALQSRKYTPATLEGSPVEVLYTFKLKFVRPQ
jgi:TonB family protein